MYRHNSELFFLPFQGTFDQLDVGYGFIQITVALL